MPSQTYSASGRFRNRAARTVGIDKLHVRYWPSRGVRSRRGARRTLCSPVQIEVMYVDIRYDANGSV